MKKNVFLLLFLLINGIISLAQIPLLSPKADISVLTILPGDELYSKFGHSAIRVKDPVNNIDWVFNYGTFDFNTPHFYLKFIKGRLNYMLSVQSFRNFYYEYKYEKRSVHEQILNLTYNQKKEIFNFLLWNAQPENKFYLYDFLYDNCATRVRDVLINQLKDSLITPNYSLNLTFRKAFNQYVKNKPWLVLGINLLNGMAADKKLDLYHGMFLPDYVDTALSISKIIKPNGEKIPLVKKSHFIYKFDKPALKTPWYQPWLIFSIIFVLILVLNWNEYKSKRRWRWLDFSLFFIIGLMGTILLGLWLFTEHLVAKNNLNILWLFPVHLIFAFFVVKKQIPKWVYSYASFFRFYYIAFLISMPFLPQYIDYAAIPIVLILLVRLQLIKAQEK